MNKTGQISMGTLLVTAIGIIVALVLFQASAPNIGAATGTQTVLNQTFTVGAAGTVTDLVGQELLSTPIVTNATSGVAISATNYTIAETLSVADGLKRVSYTTATGSPFASRPVNISYNYGAEGYIDSSGGRSIAGIILLLAAVAIAVVVVGRVMKDGEIVFGK